MENKLSTKLTISHLFKIRYRADHMYVYADADAADAAEYTTHHRVTA